MSDSRGSGNVRLRIVPVDTSDRAAFQAYYDTWVEASTPGRTDPPFWTIEELSAAVENATTFAFEPFHAFEGETPVGAGELRYSKVDNPNVLDFYFAVREEYRRRGHGTEMLDFVVTKAKEMGREILGVEVSLSAGLEDTAPSKSFLETRGFTLRNTEIRRQQRLPLPAERLDELAAKAAEKASAYRLVTWVDETPDEYAVQYAHLKGLLMTEAPTGDLVFEGKDWDVERLREDERLYKAQGRTVYTTIAVAENGTIAGHTQLAVPSHDPGRSFQWDSLVLQDHRGHRLGLALKVANLQALQADHPEIERVETWNAEQNGPMIKVNEELGYRVIEVLQEWQR